MVWKSPTEEYPTLPWSALLSAVANLYRNSTLLHHRNIMDSNFSPRATHLNNLPLRPPHLRDLSSFLKHVDMRAGHNLDSSIRGVL